MQPLGDMTFDHVITTLRTLHHIFHKDIHDTIALCHVIYIVFYIPICHSCMSCDHVIC